MLELHSAAPRATLTPLSCSPNFPRAQYLDIRTLSNTGRTARAAVLFIAHQPIILESLHLSKDDENEGIEIFI